jgi:hypothetical protein
MITANTRFQSLRIIFAAATAALFLLLVSCGGGESPSSGEQSANDGQQIAEESSAESTEAEKEAGSTSNTETEHNDSAGGNSVEAGGISLSWEIADGKASFTLEAPTEGWVAVGFHPTRMMKDADLIIGYVEDGEAAARDDFGNWFTSHDADTNLGGSDDLEEIAGSQNGGRTTLRFTLPLDSGDDYDQPLVPGEETEIILAYGDSDDFNSIHSKTASVTVEF